MIRLSFLLFFSGLSFGSTTVDLGKVRLSEAISLLYSESTKSSYVIHSDLLQDDRLVTLRSTASVGLLKDLLIEYGYQIKSKSGVDFIVKSEIKEHGIHVYKPLYRSATYLTRNINSAFPGVVASSRTIDAPESAQVRTNPPEGTAAALIQAHSDILSITSDHRLSSIISYLKKIDVPSPQVQIDGFVVEVQKTRTSGSAVKALLAAIPGLEISVGSSISSPYASLKITHDNFSLAISQLSSRANFKFLSSPSIRVTSGELAQFAVGQEVPTLGNVTSDNGNPVQSIDYRDSGIIFNVRPNVLGETINLELEQQISTFGKTETGVNNSPTLSKRSVKTNLDISSGEMVIIGGLQDSKTNESSSLFTRFFNTFEHVDSSSQVLLVVRAIVLGGSDGS